MSVSSTALLAECLVFIEELGHGPACDTWSGRRDAKCDCNIPLLIRMVKQQLKANASGEGPSIRSKDAMTTQTKRRQ
jgi:hypothetical protein